VSSNPIIEHPCPVIRKQVIVASSITNYSQVALGGQVVVCCSELSSRSSEVMMEAVRTSEKSVDNHFTQQYNPEDNSEHHTHHRENLKSHMVVCLPLDPSLNGAKLSEDNGFLRMMIICNTASFRGEVKPSVPCHKILRHIKESHKYQKDTL
jgi:hypothetical protein